MLRIDQQLEQKRAVSAKVRRLLFIDIKKIRRWSGLLVLLLFIFYFFIYGQVPEAEGENCNINKILLSNLYSIE